MITPSNTQGHDESDTAQSSSNGTQASPCQASMTSEKTSFTRSSLPQESQDTQQPPGPSPFPDLWTWSPQSLSAAQTSYSVNGFSHQRIPETSQSIPTSDRALNSQPIGSSFHSVPGQEPTTRQRTAATQAAPSQNLRRSQRIQQNKNTQKISATSKGSDLSGGGSISPDGAFDALRSTSRYQPAPNEQNGFAQQPLPQVQQNPVRLQDQVNRYGTGGILRAGDYARSSHRPVGTVNQTASVVQGNSFLDTRQTYQPRNIELPPLRSMFPLQNQYGTVDVRPYDAHWPNPSGFVPGMTPEVPSPAAYTTRDVQNVSDTCQLVGWFQGLRAWGYHSSLPQAYPWQSNDSPGQIIQQHSTLSAAAPNFVMPVQRQSISAVAPQGGHVGPH